MESGSLSISWYFICLGNHNLHTISQIFFISNEIYLRVAQCVLKAVIIYSSYLEELLKDKILHLEIAHMYCNNIFERKIEKSINEYMSGRKIELYICISLKI